MKINRNSTDRGSALLVSLMVMVGLSLLGLGFVAISETESAISVNERNYTQTLQVAEAGARTAVEWFQNPKWALAQGLMPANTIAIKQERQSALSPSATYQGYYKPTGLLFDLPHKPASPNRFFGVDPKSADIVINQTTAPTFLDQFNARLFGNNFDGGRVVDIRMYAPPILDVPAATPKTTFNGREYWNGGTRYGVATIEVTAEKRRFPSDPASPLVARRRVRLVVSEFPFPGPEGPLQSQEGISTNGAMRVHWGKIVSIADLALKREMISIPWENAWSQAKFECGYNSPNYVSCATLDNAATPTINESIIFPEMLGKQYEDPWFQARARGNITTDTGLNAPQPYPYTNINSVENGVPVAGYSNQFQFQDSDAQPLKREVLFPRINYKFWKQVAISGQGQQGMHYLRWVSGTTDTFVDSKGTQKTFRAWVDTKTGGAEGFFFFDTTTGVDPQLPDGKTIDATLLTPAIDLSGGSIFMKGFIYLNALSFGSQGLGGAGADYYVNSPGEPFRDVGFQDVDALGQLMVDALGQPVLVNYTNYQWDYKDLNANGKFDLKVVQSAVTYHGADSCAPAAAPCTKNTWVPVPFVNGCTTFGQTGACSEPHEPYLNIIYPSGAACCSGAGAPTPFLTGWEDPAGAITRRAKKRATGSTLPVTCTATSSDEDCTSNIYDKDGGMLTIDAGGPILDGIFYNQGGYDSTGNATYFGSVIVRGLAAKAGTVDVWFDESLVKGDWQKRFENMPRVLITAHETDQ
jgi:hypothetical protein